MSMKKFLILFILISFVTVSCAGPQVKYGWTKPDFSEEQFEKDRQECIDSIDRGGLKSYDECFVKKGYELAPPASRDQNPESNILKDYVIPIALIPAIPIFAGLQFGCILYYAIFSKDGHNPCVPH
jgi:hypothetical protein